MSKEGNEHQIALSCAKMRGLAHTLKEHCDYGLEGAKSVDRLRLLSDEICKEANSILFFERLRTEKPDA